MRSQCLENLRVQLMSHQRHSMLEARNPPLCPLRPKERLNGSKTMCSNLERELNVNATLLPHLPHLQITVESREISFSIKAICLSGQLDSKISCLRCGNDILLSCIKITANYFGLKFVKYGQLKDYRANYNQTKNKRP